jgi:hypothetical protein
VSLKQRMSHGPAKFVADLDLQAHNDQVIEKDRELVANLAFKRDQQNPNWLSFKTRPTSVPNKNKSGHGPEHAEANVENAYHDALIENASRSLAVEVDKALNV